MSARLMGVLSTLSHRPRADANTAPKDQGAGSGCRPDVVRPARHEACLMPCFLLCHRHEPRRVRSRLRLVPWSRQLAPAAVDHRVVPHRRACDLVARRGSQRGRRARVAPLLRRRAHDGDPSQRGIDPMSAQRDHWTELASRETDGLLVSLHWSSQDGDLKVAVADLRLPHAPRIRRRRRLRARRLSPPLPLRRLA